MSSTCVFWFSAIDVIVLTCKGQATPKYLQRLPTARNVDSPPGSSANTALSGTRGAIQRRGSQTTMLIFVTVKLHKEKINMFVLFC